MNAIIFTNKLKIINSFKNKNVPPPAISTSVANKTVNKFDKVNKNDVETKPVNENVIKGDAKKSVI